MITLKAEKRDANVKAKKLRKEGYTTGVLYGKEMTEAVPLQFTSADALRFIGKNGKGSQVVLEIGDEKVSAVVKDIDPVHFENADIVQGIVEQELSEIHYKAEPDKLLDPIVIDFKEVPKETRNMYVKDLHLEEKGVQLITPEDDVIFHVADYAKTEDEDTEEEAEA